MVRDCELIIKKGDEAKEHLKLSELSKAAEQLTLSYVNMVEVDNHTPTDILNTQAAIKNFKIMPDGSWKILVDYHIRAVRQFRHRNTCIKFTTTSNETYNKGTFPSDFPYGGDREDIAAAFRQMGFTEVTTEIVLRDTALAQSFYGVFYDLMKPSYSEWLIEYGTSGAIEISEKDTENFYETTAEGDFLICFSSDGTFKKVYEKCYCTPLIMDIINHEGYINDEPIANSKHIAATTDKKGYPYLVSRSSYKQIIGGYWWEFLIYTFRGLAIKDRFKEDARSYCDIVYNKYRYDSRNLPNAPPYNQLFYEIDENFSFPVQDGYSVKIKPVYHATAAYTCSFGSIYDKEGNPVVGNIFPTVNNAHEWHTSFTPLKDGTFLFGAHGDNLYRLTSTGEFTQVGSGLKNFRLREMKNISRAKK